MPAKPARGRSTARGKRAQTDVEESMADCIAEVDDVTAGLDAEEGEALPAAPATALIPESVLRHRLDKSKKAEATAIKEKELMQKRLSDVEAQLELAKANVGDVVQLQSPSAKVLKRPLDNFCLKRFLDKRYPLTRNSFPQRRKAVAHVRTGSNGPSVPLPAQGTLMDVLKKNGQHFSRDMQKSLVPRMIAAAGYRWHNAVSRDLMIQILRQVTIEKGGVYVHWDALEARSQRKTNAQAVAITFNQSHAHATRKHRAAVSAAGFRLFVNTPDSVPENKILNFVKEEVFGISDGRPIIDKDHPVMVEMFAQDIIGGTLLIPVCTRLLLRMS